MCGIWLECRISWNIDQQSIAVRSWFDKPSNWNKGTANCSYWWHWSNILSGESDHPMILWSWNDCSCIWWHIITILFKLYSKENCSRECQEIWNILCESFKQEDINILDKFAWNVWYLNTTRNCYRKTILMSKLLSKHYNQLLLNRNN